VGHAGVQAEARNQQARAVRAEKTQQIRVRRVERSLAQAAPAGIAPARQAAGEHHGGARAALAQLAHQLRHGGGRRADDGQVGRLGQVGHAGVARQVAQLLVFGIDGEQLALEAAALQIGQQRRAHAARARRGAD
jgi:hypothetical protein